MFKAWLKLLGHAAVGGAAVAVAQVLTNSAAMHTPDGMVLPVIASAVTSAISLLSTPPGPK